MHSFIVEVNCSIIFIGSLITTLSLMTELFSCHSWNAFNCMNPNVAAYPCAETVLSFKAAFFSLVNLMIMAQSSIKVNFPNLFQVKSFRHFGISAYGIFGELLQPFGK